MLFFVAKMKARVFEFANVAQLESSVEQAIQTSLDLSTFRTLFDEVIREHPDLTERLSPTADIVKDPIFEKAICNCKTDNSLNDMKQPPLNRSRLENLMHLQVKEEESLSLAARALKRRNSSSELSMLC